MIQLKNDYWLRVLPYGEDSPMENHKGGEIAADDENKVFYVHEVLVVTNGLDSIVKACMSYPVKSVRQVPVVAPVSLTDADREMIDNRMIAAGLTPPNH